MSESKVMYRTINQKKWLKLAFILSIGSLLLPSNPSSSYPPLGWHWSDLYYLSDETTSYVYSPTLVLDSKNNVHFVWSSSSNFGGEGNDDDLFYRYFNSTTGVFSPTEIVTSESSNFTFNFDVKIDQDDNIHVVWSDQMDSVNTGTDFDIFYKYRDVGTGVWSFPETISTESTNDSYSPTFDFDDDGFLHVFWLDTTNYLSEGVDFDIFYKNKNLANNLWSITEVITTQSNGDANEPVVKIDDLNNIHLIWEDTTDYAGANIDRDIFYKLFNATTNLWSSTEVVSTESTSTSNFAQLDLDNQNNIHIVWGDYTDYLGAGTDEDVFYKVKNGTTSVWNTTSVLSDFSVAHSRHPYLAFDGHDNLHIAWSEIGNFLNSGTDRDLIYFTHDSVSSVWSNPELISIESNGTSYVPIIVIDNKDTVHITWQDDLNNDGDVAEAYYRFGIDLDNIQITFTETLTETNTATTTQTVTDTTTQTETETETNFSVSAIAGPTITSIVVPDITITTQTNESSLSMFSVIFTLVLLVRSFKNRKQALC